MLYTKHIKTLVTSGALALACSSCSSSFLEKEPTQYVSPEQLARATQWNPNILLGQTAGSTQLVFDSFTTTTSSHDDFGQKANDIHQDILSGDMEVENIEYGGFGNTARLLAHLSKNAAYTYRPWRLYYKIIFSANSTINLLGSDDYTKLPESTTAQQKYYWGISKALRAYAYYNLAQFYCKPYDEAANEPALPIYKEISATSASRSTLKEVYAQIFKDLTDAREALVSSKITRTAKSDINVDVIDSYLAYAYLQTGNYQEAYTAAKRVIDSGRYSLIPAKNLLTNGFNNVSNPEFIWAVDITKDNTQQLITFFAHIDVYTYGYAYAGDQKVINGDLQKEIPQTDLRGKWFSKGDSILSDGGTYEKLHDGLPIRKFFSAANTKKEYGADRSWLNDIHLMRLSELYLIGMEAAARKGDEAEAKNLLKALMKERTEANNLAQVNAEIDALSGTQLLDRIYYNWRVELWGEGRSLITMKRFKKTTKRTDRSIHHAGESISYNDERLTFQIPQRETANNPRL